MKSYYDKTWQPTDAMLTELVQEVAAEIAKERFRRLLLSEADEGPPTDSELETAIEDARRIYVTASRLCDAAGCTSNVEMELDREAAEAAKGETGGVPPEKA